MSTRSFLDPHQVIPEFLALVIKVALQSLQVISICLFLFFVIVRITERVEAGVAGVIFVVLVRIIFQVDLCKIGTRSELLLINSRRII